VNESLISNSVFFDEEYYLGQLKEPLPAGMSPAKHYLEKGWRHGLDPGPLFSTARYLWRNEDVREAGLNPLLHYVTHGLAEGRRAWSSPEVMRWQLPWLRHPELALAETEKSKALWPRLSKGDKVVVYSHSRGHFVFLQFQKMIVQSLKAIGVDAVPADENSRMPASTPALSMVIAPHDFFYLEGSPDPADRRFSDAILVNTEQMPSRWFARILALLMRAPMVLDMNVQTAASLCRLGVNARFLPLGHVAQNEIFQSEVLENPRDMDLLWIGSNSKRRQIWAHQHQDIFRRHKSFVRLVSVVGALSAENPAAISPVQYAKLARRSKIQINIHHFNMPYFEWQRIVHYGLLQGNCVVTEVSPKVPGLRPGVDYLEAKKEEIPLLLDWLLRSPDGKMKLEEVRRAGYRNAIEIYDLARTLENLFAVKG
jgi:hypothetical protein